METILIGSNINTAFLFALCFGLVIVSYKMALQISREEYRDLPLWNLVVHILFYWIGGSAFLAGVIMGIANNGKVDQEMWTFLFIIILVPGLYGIVKGLNKQA